MRNETTDAFRGILDRLSAPAGAYTHSTDGQLLTRFHAAGDEAAFSEQVRRHGGRVAGVCRRWLGDPGRAEDATQAVFLLLARRAGRLSGEKSLAGWLHTAAIQIARTAKRADARRVNRERQAARPERVDPADPSWAEVRRQLDADSSPSPMWGWCGRPLVYKDTLITTVGGEGSTVVPFDKTTGKEVWKALSAKEIGYAPPTLIDVKGTGQLVIWLGEAVVGLHPTTGQKQWSLPLAPGYAMSITRPANPGTCCSPGPCLVRRWAST